MVAAMAKTHSLSQGGSRKHSGNTISLKLSPRLTSSSTYTPSSPSQTVLLTKGFNIFQAILIQTTTFYSLTPEGGVLPEEGFAISKAHAVLSCHCVMVVVSTCKFSGTASMPYLPACCHAPRQDCHGLQPGDTVSPQINFFFYKLHWT